MRGDDADFTAYLAARWPSLVRTLVLLGCGRHEAAAVAQTGVAHCWRHWDRVRGADDVDVHVYATVLGRLHRHRRRVPAPSVPAAPASEEPTDDELLLHALEIQLDRLDLDEREAVVLRLGAELSEEQVADVLDVPLESAQARITHGLGRLDLGGLQEAFRRGSESIEVLAPPYDAIIAEARARRRRQVRVVVAGVVAAAVVLGGLTWWADRGPGPEEDLAPAPVRRETNPVPVAWYADGRLHLEKVVVTVPAVTDLVELNGGAVYGDRGGTVAFVAADGARRRIGHKDPDSPVVASTGESWAAWVDPGAGSGGPSLEAYDVSAGRMLATQDLPSADVRPIAIDQRRVYYETPDGDFGWAPGTEPPERLDRDGLIDIEAATRVYQVAGAIEIVQPFFNVSYVRAGSGARLSAAGSVVLSRVPGPAVAAGTPFQPLLYDARSGDLMPSGVGPDDRAIEASFGRDNTVVYLIAPPEPGPADARVVVRSCELSSAECTDVATAAAGAGPPLLAR